MNLKPFFALLFVSSVASAQTFSGDSWSNVKSSKSGSISFAYVETPSFVYKDKNGVAMSSGGYTLLDGGNTRWVGPGGQNVYKNGSSYVIVRHAYDATNNGAPTMLINDLYFSGGWPTY